MEVIYSALKSEQIDDYIFIDSIDIINGIGKVRTLLRSLK